MDMAPGLLSLPVGSGEEERYQREEEVSASLYLMLGKEIEGASPPACSLREPGVWFSRVPLKSEITRRLEDIPPQQPE